ncbi:hypothetical protein [Streptomyces sp. NPDC018031]|uniref:hypothetical protein n=1 Tax=Streptomyces sp. NPDC018031 TaxID=3365033 RepID=UPI003790D95A
MPHAPLLRERQSPSSSPSPGGQDDHNPFAPPPEGSPDRPWQPRHQPTGDPGGNGGGNGSWGPAGGPDGNGGRGPDGGQGDGSGDPGDGSGGQDDGSGGPQQPPRQPPAWGSQWSSRQPGRQSGGWGGNQGERPGGQNGQRGSGPRWDPTDPAQRRARYALLAGMWAFFFALFSLPEIALLLGALALYWGISSLRGKPGRARPDRAAVAPDAPPPAPDAQRAALPAPRAGGRKPQATAAISGLVTGGIALVIVAATYSVQLVYSDYYSCVDDALTNTSREQCEDKLPEQLRPLLSTDD